MSIQKQLKVILLKEYLLILLIYIYIYSTYKDIKIFYAPVYNVVILYRNFNIIFIINIRVPSRNCKHQIERRINVFLDRHSKIQIILKQIVLIVILITMDDNISDLKADETAQVSILFSEVFTLNRI